MWIVILISFITYGIWQIAQMPYFFLKTIFLKHYIRRRVGVVSCEEEEFNGYFNITRRPVGFKTIFDYFTFAKPQVMKAQSEGATLYYAYGALNFLSISKSRRDVHKSLILPLHLMYFTRTGCEIIQSECNRLRKKVLRLSIDDGEEGFFNGHETIGFSDAINIGLEGECPSWMGHASKGIIACAIVAVFQSKAEFKDKKKLELVYRILKSRTLLSSAYPFLSNNHNKDDFEALKASYEVLLDYDNNLFYRTGYRNIIRASKETKCSFVKENILKLKEILKPQLSN